MGRASAGAAGLALKVLYVNSLYPPDIGGETEVLLAEIVRGFRQRGQQASVLATHGGRGILEETVDGVPVCRIGSKNIYRHFPPGHHGLLARAVWQAIDSFNLSMARAVGRRLDEDRPDLLVCHNLTGFSAAIWPQARRRHIPIVQVLHDYYTLCPRATMYRHGRSCAEPCGACTAFRLPHRRASNAVSAVIGASHATLETHLRHGLFASTAIQAVVHHARGLAAPAPPPKARDDKRPLTFGFIGALTEMNGFGLLVAAFARVARRCARPMQLLIAGDVNEIEARRLRSDVGSDRIRFLGAVTPQAFFPMLDASVVPSLWHEPFSRMALESLGMGVPVIASRRGGTAEMIQHEVNGLLFEPGERGALETALTLLAEDATLLYRMRRLARMSVSRLLDTARLLDDYEAVYRALLGEPESNAPNAASPVRPRVGRGR